jgi:hypothetical protein
MWKFIKPLSIVCLAYILLLNLRIAHSFRLAHRSATCKLSRSSSLRMESEALVVGYAGGIAESIGLKLHKIGVKVSLALDTNPYSPALQSKARSNDVKVYVGDVQSSYRLINGPLQPVDLLSLQSGRNLVVCGDDGDESLRGPIDRSKKSPSKILIEQMTKTLSPSLKSVVLVSSVSAESSEGLEKVFGAKSGSVVMSDWCRENGRPLSLVNYGKLIGGIVGAESLPFTGLPLLEPELHPSYVLRSVVMGDVNNNQYAASELCTRESLAEVTTRIIARGESTTKALVVSIAGSELTEKEWDRLFRRIANRDLAELIRIDFAAIYRVDAFLQWLVDSWFPQALVEADAATILAGARPVRAVKTSSSTIEIRWDDIAEDLTVKAVGALEIKAVPTTSADGSSPYLTVTRKASSPLPRESQLIDKLVEGINKSAYKKGFCAPLESVAN